MVFAISNILLQLASATCAISSHFFFLDTPVEMNDI
jgi:hypothetical protein